MTTYRLMDGLSGRPGSGPSTGTSFTGNLVIGCCFSVTSGGLWLSGYYQWIPATGGQLTGQKFALWQATGSSAGTAVPNSEVIAGTLTAGAWNLMSLATPLLLTPNVIYVAAGAAAFSSTNFPETKNQFGTGNPFAGGIVNGPLNGYSSTSGTNPVPGSWNVQQPFATSGADPTVNYPNTNDSDANLWLDVQVTDQAPPGATYRAFPTAQPTGFSVPSTSNDYTLAMQFSLSSPCTLQKIWHYSPSGSVVLPSRCGIWDVTSTTEVAGTDNSSPSWLLPGGGAASAGAGWVYCDYSSAGVTLNASQNYKVSTFYGASTTNKWLAVTTGYWTTGGPGASGITAGPLTVPNNAGASPGQDSWNNGATWTYPATSNSPENDWIDVEVQPLAGAGAPPAIVAPSAAVMQAANW